MIIDQVLEESKFPYYPKLSKIELSDQPISRQYLISIPPENVFRG